MKILLVASLYYPYIKGGGEISTQLLAEELVKLRHEVSLITIAKEYKKEVINGVKIYRFPSPNIYWSFESKNYSHIKKVFWHIFDSYNINIKNNFLKILLEVNPDIVHSSTIEDISPYIWKITKERNIPVVHTLRSYTLLCPKATMYKNDSNCEGQCRLCKLITYPKKILSNNVDAVVGISKFILDTHMKSGYFKNATQYMIHNPYNELNHQIDIKSNEITFGFVGRLEKNKGIEYLLERYMACGLKFKLFVYGSTNDKEYENYLYKKYKSSKIIFFGYEKPENIYNSITHLIVPSLWNEPFGRIIVEAYSYGIPVLGANTGGIPELIECGKTGYIFDINREGDFLEMLIKFSEVNFNREYIVNNAEKFRKDKIAFNYIEVYNSLIGTVQKSVSIR